MASKELRFTGSIVVDGDLSKLDLPTLREYLEDAVCLDLDTEEHGQYSDELEVVGLGLDWESLGEQ